MTSDETREAFLAAVELSVTAVAAVKTAKGGGPLGVEVPLAFAVALVGTCRGKVWRPADVLALVLEIEGHIDSPLPESS